MKLFDKICKETEKCDIQRFEWGEVAWLHEPSNLLDERLSAGLVKFFPGKMQKQHIHFGEEQIMFIIQGIGIHMLNGVKEEIREGMLVHCPPFAEHEVINTGQGDLLFLIIYTPSKVIEPGQNIYMVKGKHILDLIELDVIERFQKDISEILGFYITILDSDFKIISKNNNEDRFCITLENIGLCSENKSLQETGISKVYMCCCNVMKMVIPVIVSDEIIGYLNSSSFIINKPENYQDIINTLVSNHKEDYNELITLYNEIPVLPKSRMYSLQESLDRVSKIISSVIENNIAEKELMKKNTEILKNNKEKLDLEEALKEANQKLMKSKLSTAIRDSSINSRNIVSKEYLEYPIEQEIKLSACIRKMDIDECKRTISAYIVNYKEKDLDTSGAKEIFIEMLMSLSRIIFTEAEDEDTFLYIRKKYKEKMVNCNSYSCIEQIFLQFSEEVVDILRGALLKGKNSLIQKVNQYIKNNYNQDITLNLLARIFYISPNYLSTIFNEKNNMSLNDYINKVRVEKAKEYLLETDMKISEIGKRVGYSQLSYFGSVFKKNENCTPNQWRQENNKN